MGRKPLDVEKIVMDLMMSDDSAAKKKLSKKIFDIAYKNGIYPSSIHDFYIARGKGEFEGLTVPAIKEGYKGPVFIQADHCQLNAKKFQENPDKEVETLQALIEDAVGAHFYNIDIDSSTLVDLSKKDIKKQQQFNYEVCAKLTQFIRRIEPRGVTVSVGGEIGEVGHQNSTPEDLRAFMTGYKERLRKGLTGISKISIQT